jgi:hypothetical protein
MKVFKGNNKPKKKDKNKEKKERNSETKYISTPKKELFPFLGSCVRRRR